MTNSDQDYFKFRLALANEVQEKDDALGSVVSRYDKARNTRVITVPFALISLLKLYSHMRRVASTSKAAVTSIRAYNAAVAFTSQFKNFLFSNKALIKMSSTSLKTQLVVGIVVDIAVDVVADFIEAKALAEAETDVFEFSPNLYDLAAKVDSAFGYWATCAARVINTHAADLTKTDPSYRILLQGELTTKEYLLTLCDTRCRVKLLEMLGKSCPAALCASDGTFDLDKPSAFTAITPEVGSSYDVELMLACMGLTGEYMYWGFLERDQTSDELIHMDKRGFCKPLNNDWHSAMVLNTGVEYNVLFSRVNKKDISARYATIYRTNNLKKHFVTSGLFKTELLMGLATFGYLPYYKGLGANDTVEDYFVPLDLMRTVVYSASDDPLSYLSVGFIASVFKDGLSGFKNRTIELYEVDENENINRRRYVKCDGEEFDSHNKLFGAIYGKGGVYARTEED